ncbi:MAG: aminotransferase class IV [Geminicoccaceae bacterium]
MPLAEARIPVTEWGYRRSDVTYDVTGVFFGAFFRLDDHIARFRRSMDRMRMQPKESDAEIREVLLELVRRTGLREAYVAMDCLRSRPPRGMPMLPVNARSYLVCFATPWVWLFSEEQQARGVHAMINIPAQPRCLGRPHGQKLPLGDLTSAFEAHDAGFDTAVLLDGAGNVTEAGLQRLRRDRRHRRLATRRCARRHHPPVRLRVCEALDIPFCNTAHHGCRARRPTRSSLSTTAGGVMPVSRRAHPRQRPAGPISARLRETRVPPGLARHAGRLRGGVSAAVTSGHTMP